MSIDQNQRLSMRKTWGEQLHRWCVGMFNTVAMSKLSISYEENKGLWWVTW